MKWLVAFLLLPLSALPLPAQNTPVSETLGEVNVAGVDVSGLTPEQARARLAEELDPKLDTELVLTDGAKELRRARRWLGITLDLPDMLRAARAGQRYVPLMLEVNQAVMKSALERMADEFAFEGRSAKVYQHEGAARIVPAEYARKVDPAASAAKFEKLIEDDAATTVLQLAVKKTPPAIRTEDLAGIDGVIGQFSTRYNPREVDRTHNLQTAVAAIDGKVLKSGQVFSLNDTVGERTPERGYRKAPIFVDRQIEPGYGGGVSQVTGTLFNAALVAGLPIVSYRTHSRPVRYLPLGRDATVAWGSFDMKFRNDTGASIYIDYRMGGGTMTATLFGKTTPGREYGVEVESDRVGDREIRATLYRVHKRDGEVVKRERVGSSHYKWEEDTNGPNE